MDIQQAFENICADAQAAAPRFVSLYRSVQVYGGPEEGGWWYTVNALEASKRVPTVEAAEALRDAVEVEAARLSREGLKRHGDYCREIVESCDARGIDDYDSYGSNDGPDMYFVTIEAVAGARDNSAEPVPVWC